MANQDDSDTTEQPTDNEQSTTQSDEQSDERSTNESEQAAEQSDEQPTEETDQPTNQSDEKPADESEQPTEQAAEQADQSERPDQTAEQPAEGGGGSEAAAEQPAAVGSATGAGNLFSFSPQSGEAIGARIARCCEEALAEGPMGKKDRHDFYRDFISCQQETTSQAAETLTGVATSCAMFVRAVRHWCGAAPTGPYKQGTGMFVSMGNVSFSHPAFVPHDGATTPNPGDYFYISPTRESLKGHTGIFVEQLGPKEWRTAEGGGGGESDGTLCRFKTRTISGKQFSDDDRTLWGWFDCTKVGLPESP